MKQDWNERARSDAEFFIAKTQDSKAFDASAADGSGLACCRGSNRS